MKVSSLAASVFLGLAALAHAQVGAPVYDWPSQVCTAGDTRVRRSTAGRHGWTP
jgi:hypothetical protein